MTNQGREHCWRFVPFVSCCGNYWYDALLQAWPLLKLQTGFYLALFPRISFLLNWIFLAFYGVGADGIAYSSILLLISKCNLLFISMTHVCTRVSLRLQAGVYEQDASEGKMPSADM